MMRKHRHQQEPELSKGTGKKQKRADSGRSSSGTAPATCPTIEVPLHEVIHQFVYGGSDSEAEPPEAGQSTSRDDLAWWSEVEEKMGEDDLSVLAFLRAPSITNIDPVADLSQAHQLADLSIACRRRIVGKRPAVPHEPAMRPEKRRRPG